MELFEVANRTTRTLEYMLVGTVIGLYVALIYVSAMCDRCLASLYLIATSFIYYVNLLLHSPAQPLCPESAAVRGLCSTCNRVRGARTRHCHICNQCYSRRDHHCMLIGRCVAESNMRDFYLCILFMLLFLVSWLFQRECKPLVGLLVACVLGSFLWLSLCIAEGKTSHEMLKMERIVISPAHLASLLKYLRDDPVGILLPLLHSRKRAPDTGTR